MLSDSLDGGVTEMAEEIIGVSARLDERSFWVSGYVAVRDLDHDTLPESVSTTLVGRDAGTLFGIEGLNGRTIIDTGTSDADTWWVKLEADIVSVSRPSVLSLLRERVVLTPAILRTVLSNATDSTARFLLTGLLIMMMTTGFLIAVMAEGLPIWLRITAALIAPALMIRWSNGRDMEAHKRVEKRGRILSSLA